MCGKETFCVFPIVGNLSFSAVMIVLQSVVQRGAYYKDFDNWLCICPSIGPWKRGCWDSGFKFQTGMGFRIQISNRVGFRIQISVVEVSIPISLLRIEDTLLQMTKVSSILKRFMGFTFQGYFLGFKFQSGWDSGFKFQMGGIQDSNSGALSITQAKFLLLFSSKSALDYSISI